MIKYNNNTIYNWNFDASNVIKVYRNNAIVFYKVSGESPTPEWKVCFAVVDDISQYTDREFEDVYDNATDKWYKLNNLNQYEEYGVYGSGRNVTTYKGKLTIDDGYEYEWNDSSWVNLGEVTGSSRVPSGYVELTYAQTSKVASSSSNAFRVPIDLQETNNYIYEFTPLNWEESYYGHILGGNDGSTNFPKLGIFKLDNGWGDETRRFISAFWNYNLETRKSSPGGNYRVYDNVKSKFTMNLHNYTVGQGADIKVENEGYETVTHTSTTILRSGYSVTSGIYNIDVFSTSNGNSSFIALEQFHNLKVETNEGVAVYDYVPCERKSDNKVGLYDVVNNAFYSPSEFTLTAGDEASHTEYPKYYSEKSEPLDNLTFNTMAEAQTYAYNNCVYDGIRAIIDGDRYYFDSSDENGWVKVSEYYTVEDVTPNGASGWTISGSDAYNPDSSYYDDFDLETSWTSGLYKIAKVTIYGYDHFTYYLRSCHDYSSSYGYVMATNVDEVSTPPSSMDYSSSSAITNTYYWGKLPKSAVNLSNYRRVTYNNLDKTVEHTFYVYYYGRTYSSYLGNATILIPKDQSQENWEQVTFSASSNVASIQKYLYIDGNYSASGGTNIWYSRWIVGLPSGSHSSSTNYSSYDYCPNVTSSTFTSVAGEQRQVNFTYDGTTSKSLSFRLVDGSGNVLTPSDTVYYNMTLVNPCNVTSSSSNLTFPRSQYVKVGGSFYFTNSSNRHYIYGYSPDISLNYYYHVDNYQSTFDITYTKLNDEAVTIAYTTYDPNDSETPAFKTDITYPYNGGTTSSTTLTSYDVPYTYPYTVKQTNAKFSADSQSYTAGQAARTINFTLYPNNREFATVADLEAYGYAWEGMTAYVGSDKYVYQNGEWVYNPSRLPQGYTEVEYIENVTPNKAYIDTGFKPNQKTKAIADFQYVTTNTHPRCFGCGPYNGLAYILNAENGITSNGVWNWKFGNTSAWLTTGVHTDFNRHTAIIDSGKLYLDGTVIGSTTVTTFQLTDNIGLFGFIQNGSQGGTSAGEYMFGKFYSFQIYDDGTLVRDLVPCISPNDVVGMYDVVNDVFYSSANSYNFVSGPEVA